MVDAGIPVVSVAVKFTIAPHWPGALFTGISAGAVTNGAIPDTVTLKEKLVVKPTASVAV